MEHHTHKSFFEKYQTFFSIIIASLVIAGGIVLSKTLPNPSIAGTGSNEIETRESVKDSLLKTASKLRIDKKKLSQCLDDKTTEQRVAEDLNSGFESGVTGTPTFFIIKRTLNESGVVTSENQIPLIGARDAATFTEVISSGKAPADQGEITGSKIILTEEDHWLGPKNAEVVIVEYSDIDCPFCKRAKPIVDQLLKDNPGYAFVYRHFPLEQLHPFAAYKSQATECVAINDGSDAFWKFLDVIAK